jgi:CheY-like chemotaxis protein/two-component sensor histidine kinase
LINDLLDLGKIDSGHIAISLETIAVGEVLSNLNALLLPLAESAGLILSVQSGDGLPNIRADRTRLNQVLLNLTTNAIKYNRPEGRVEISCELVDPTRLRLTVADTGVGIAEELRQGLFEPFNRLGREASTIEGSGIGLALSRKLMGLMGGSIDYSSHAGQGSRFWIDIPVAVFDGKSDTAPVEDAGFVDSGGGGTVLCIDDAPAGLELVASIIEAIPGARVLTAITAEDGLVQARLHHPALILMDINLPGMDGFEALAELRRHEETKAIPVFALSAAAAPQDIERGLAAGFERYLVKPFKAHDLLAVAGRQYDDADVRLQPELTRQGQPINLGKINIKKNKVKVSRRQQPPHLGCIACFGDKKSLLPKAGGQKATARDVIVNQQQGTRNRH